MNITTLYNSDGRAVAYVDDDGQSIYLYDGTPVAWCSDESIYNYNGAYLGWFEDGWVIGRNGDRVFFTDDAVGGPARPPRNPPPARGARRARPARGAREARPSRPAPRLAWSDNSDESFFDA